MDSDPALQSLLAHYRSMPPVAAMRLEIAGADAFGLRLGAPLSAHVNDKGCAFGGSLVSLMTLAGWGVATLALERAGLHGPSAQSPSNGCARRRPLSAASARIPRSRPRRCGRRS